MHDFIKQLISGYGFYSLLAGGALLVVWPKLKEWFNGPMIDAEVSKLLQVVKSYLRQKGASPEEIKSIEDAVAKTLKRIADDVEKDEGDTSNGNPTPKPA